MERTAGGTAAKVRMVVETRPMIGSAEQLKRKLRSDVERESCGGCGVKATTQHAPTIIEHIAIRSLRVTRSPCSLTPRPALTMMAKLETAAMTGSCASLTAMRMSNCPTHQSATATISSTRCGTRCTRPPSDHRIMPCRPTTVMVTPMTVSTAPLSW